jgi:hypothetical protein
MSQGNKPAPPTVFGEERAIRASGTVAGATILCGAIGAFLGGPVGTVIGATIGAASGVALSVASAHQSSSNNPG